MCLEVTNFPSFPTNGESFTINVIARVGSSISIRGKAIGSFISANVSPISMSSIPAIQTMSPASASSISTLFKPS